MPDDKAQDTEPEARFSDRARSNAVMRPEELAYLTRWPDAIIEEICQGFADDAEAGHY